MTSPDTVCVLIPTLNEAETIGSVVSGFAELGYENILVIDGKSTDATREIAKENGANVVVQRGTGKGRAVREAVRLIDAEIIVTVDGDGTYRPEDIESLIEPIRNGNAEHVIGNRFAGMREGSMTKLNRVGNRLINRVFKTIHGENFHDILSGYRAFTNDVLSNLRLTEGGFGIEAQMSVECVKHNVETEVVPIAYLPRPAGSATNLRPVRDGAVIIHTIYRLAKTNNPLFYWGFIGLSGILLSIAVGGFVLFDWFFRGVSHQVLATVSAFGLLFGAELILFGILSDMIIALHREMLREL